MRGLRHAKISICKIYCQQALGNNIYVTPRMFDGKHAVFNGVRLDSNTLHTSNVLLIQISTRVVVVDPHEHILST